MLSLSSSLPNLEQSPCLYYKEQEMLTHRHCDEYAGPAQVIPGIPTDGVLYICNRKQTQQFLR